jgi:hypothetical protein
MDIKKFIATSIRKYLNEEQETKTNLNDNFWEWFGYSEIYDDIKDEPMICYHGTDANFNTFDSDIKLKTPYAHDDHGLGFFFSNNKNFVKQFGKNIMEVYIKIENPEIMEFEQYVKAISPNGFNNGSEYPSYNGDSLRKFLIRDGKDGLIVKKYDNNIDLIVCFNPNQIKSLENDGTWDIGDNNIFS